MSLLQIFEHKEKLFERENFIVIQDDDRNVSPVSS
jgi:hypothetical protein